MNNKTVFKALLVIQTLGLLAYTFIAIQTEGPNFLIIALNNLKSLTWSGQFNLDFSCYLTLSGLWIMWRNKFTPMFIIVGFAAMILGIIFFAPYLLHLLTKENGDLKRVLIGDR